MKMVNIHSLETPGSWHIVQVGGPLGYFLFYYDLN